MFWTTASGVVKSMMTSKPVTKGGVRAAASLVLLGVEDVDAVAVLGGYLGDELAGLSMTEDENAHNGLSLEKLLG